MHYNIRGMEKDDKLLQIINLLQIIRRDGRVVEGARLESVYTVKGIKGSNPFLSAKKLVL